LIDLCGLDRKPELDGVSLIPLLRNPNGVWDRPALMTYQRGNHAVRDQRWRYIRYADGTVEQLKRWLPKKEALPAPDMKRGKK
jgi:hypothetical protein